MRRSAAPALLALAAALAGPGFARGAHAQSSLTIDAGVSRVDYDGFLASGAASVTPAVRLERAWASLTARGTALAFESGNTSLQGAVAASVYAPVTRHWRAEVAGTIGGSRYEEFSEFWHALGRARVHYLTGRRGVWLGASAGRTSYGVGSRPVLAGEGGLWGRFGPVSLTAALSGTQVGDTTWADFEGFARWRTGPLELEGNLGARVLSDGAGSGVYGEITSSYAVTPWLAVVVGTGRYPTDPIRGSIAGRYATASLRVRMFGDDTPPDRIARAAIDPVAAANGNARLTLRLTPVRGTIGVYELVIRAPAAGRVEVMASFTDWQPLSLARNEAGDWTMRWPLAPGVHRINVRVDGGPWEAPAGTTPMPDDYGGRVGVFVIG